MAKGPGPKGQRSFTVAPSEVRVTVFRVEADRELITTRFRKLAAAAAAAVVVAAIGIAIAGSHGGSRQAIWGAREGGAAGIAAAYGYPQGCLRVRISTANPGFARADFAQQQSCGYDIGFPIAVFHRISGEWHPVLYAAGYRCPVASIPPAVQRQLSLCPR
jgi:hypothetical protein